MIKISGWARRIGIKLNKYYTKKYGKNFERAEKNYEVIYIIHYVFSIFLVLAIQDIKSYPGLIIIFQIELVLLSLFLIHPRFRTFAGLILPVLGMFIETITFLILLEIRNVLKLNINIEYLTNLITVILNLIINTFIIIKVHKQNKLIELLLKVNGKVALDYDCSAILFEDNIGKKYFIETDLDEKFNDGELYEVKLKNKNISSNPTYIQGKDFFKIKYDASYFKRKMDEANTN